MNRIDDHGQPEPQINAHRRAVRAINEMLGLCKGVICDGKLPDVEVVALTEWTQANPEVLSNWHGRALYDRLRDVLSDAVVDEQERAELKELIGQVVGGLADTITAHNYPTQLFKDAAPTIYFEDHAFCFTGMFAFGTRHACHEAVTERAGIVHNGMRKDTHYLVVGTYASRDWLHSTHGRKLMKAVGQGVCSIVPEESWVKALG